MILVIDNYDSFVYNLVQYIGEYRRDIKVVRNDKVTVSEIRRMNPDRIVISPGPCTPNEAGISVDAVRAFHGTKPVLGVCLGHQCIVQAFGGKVTRAGRLMHGKTSMISHDGRKLFRGIPDPFEATRYHSLLVERKNLPGCLEVTARTTDRNEIMGVRYRGRHIVEGVQFHPESILTGQGKKLLGNFLGMKS